MPFFFLRPDNCQCCGSQVKIGVVYCMDESQYRCDRMIFKKLEQFPRYLIGEDGTLRVLKNGKSLKSQINKDGYGNIVILDIDDARRTRLIHRLVCEAFHGCAPSEQHTDVNHKDGNKANNHYLNLEWATAKENKQHASDNGLVHATMRIKIIDIVTNEEHIITSVRALARRFNVTNQRAYLLLAEHQDKAYLDRYLFRILKYSTVELKSRIGLIGVDFKRKMFVRSDSVLQMSVMMGLAEASIRIALKRGALCDGKFFWTSIDPTGLKCLSSFTDKDVELSITEHQKRKVSARITYFVKDWYRGGEWTEYGNREQIAELINITYKQLDSHLYKNGSNLIYGFSICKNTDERPSFTEDEIYNSMLADRTNSSGIKTINKIDGSLLYWPSVRSTMDFFGVTVTAVHYALNKGEYRGYSLKLL